MNPVLVQALRGGAVESFHRGALAIVDADGALHTGLGDIDWVVPHQASRLGIASLHLFGMGTDRMIRTLDHYGNCVAASIPITLMEGIETGRIQRGQRLLLLGSGAGLSMGAAILRY